MESRKLFIQFDPEYEPNVKKLTDEVVLLRAKLRDSERKRDVTSAENIDNKFELDVAKAKNIGLTAEIEILHKRLELMKVEQTMNSTLKDQNESSISRGASNSYSSTPQNAVQVPRSSTEYKCMIAGVKPEDIGNEAAAKNYVIYLAITANVIISFNDIVSVSIRKPKQQLQNSETCLIFVDFKTYEVKQKFLALKPVLPKHLSVMEALNKETLALVNKAKLLLTKSFKNVYYNNGKVYAQKSNDQPPIHITGFDHVHRLAFHFK